MNLRAGAFVVALWLGLAAPASAQVAERVRPNDNRARAGVTLNGQLAVRMEARMAMWYPDGDDKPGVLIPAFAELGRATQIPGPLIRAPGGTDVIVMVRNSIPNTTLTVHGLHARPAIIPAGTTFSDSVQIPSGAFQTLRFRLDRPGTYYYWGTITGAAFRNRTHEDAQLSGAIVVDEPGERTPRDRVFVIGMWTDTVASDSARHRQRELAVINGRSWPATDRVQYEKGDIVRWRVINASVDPHPMHLHGFSFRVTNRGDAMTDTALLARADLVNTERVAPGGTFSATWVADRLGFWLFHCEEPEHSMARGPLGYPTQSTGWRPLGGLAAGIEIIRNENDTTGKLPPPPLPYASRRLRMVLRPNVGSSAEVPLYGVSVDEAGYEPQPADTGQRVGPTMLLNRGEHTSVMVVNNLPEPVSMHWHGVEWESLFDGVPGFSGLKPTPVRGEPAPPPGTGLAPLIAPGDSLDVRLAAPRTGTFAYHASVSVPRLERAGVVGAMVVSERNKYDATKELTVLLSSPSDSVAEEQAVLVNGSLMPPPVDMRRGVTYRLRLLNFTTGRPDVVVELRQDSTTIAMWRPAASDGNELPVTDRIPQVARVSLAIGQIRDVEYAALRAGDLRLEFKTPAGRLLASLPLRVF